MKEYLRGALRNISSALEYEAVSYTSGEYRPSKPFKGLHITVEGAVSIEGVDGNVVPIFLTPGCWPFGGSAIIESGTVSTGIVALF